MTNLLVDYIGPIAKNIMFAHDKANTSANELATVISREIPKVEEREEFLKRWEVFSGTQISNSETQTSTNDVRSFDDHMLKEIAEDYAGYIGPLAGRLVRYHATTTRSLQQLLESLASEIPEVKDSEKFKKHWLRG
jgi:hypothetical protein